ncbi:hypothetical protein [Pseudomonas putida]|uniref:Uncharacterized protein n=1 Tax=Pseudomonas putida TaxID=303 RepID=A0A8I1EEJ5_PSEPU|nr:hypothetical protein [Pseudomonas putida]MBI6885179.1 hypothetical protein [Pseudomonas putida]
MQQWEAVDKLQEYFLGFVMTSLIKNALYILATVAGSFLISHYIFKIEVDQEWLFGAMIVPLIVIIILGLGKARSTPNE